MGVTTDGGSSMLLTTPGAAESPSSDDLSREFHEALADLADRWERGDSPPAESYLRDGRGWSPDRVVELIYREYRLALAAGLAPAKSTYLARFPEHRRSLERLLDLDAAFPESFLDRPGGHDDGVDADDLLPLAGDEIGPYVLEREIGRGGFARVFLARRADLEDRPVVIKVTTKPTREPWLLARARHPNIVEILTHAEVDDGALQLIAMPFLGGAALSTVLERRRHARPGRSRFLDDLDAVSAPEFPKTGDSGPTRAILRRMTDPHAFAWTTARLAEALDHARRRGVAHGDVKPSNILIAADGTPMLLDFNLAQDWSHVEPGGSAADAGGTLAYMAPERLLTLATASAGGGRPSPPDDDRAHRADVYSLGMVLLEALTGWSPAADADAPRPGRRSAFLEAARRCAATRERAVWVVRRAEAAAGRKLPAGLRAILTYDLQADPSARHARGLELAEDLDRWRADRPLAFAPEPSRGHALAKWARRRRRTLTTAAVVLAFAATLAAAFVVGRGGEPEAEGRRQALHTLASAYDEPDARVFAFQRPGEAAPARRGDSETTAVALRALRQYDVLDDGDWRTRASVRLLPDADRDDLELWLMEQALRYGRVLALRPDSPKDWRRARTTLDRARGERRPVALRQLRERLTAQIGDGASEAEAEARGAGSTPRWIDAYLDGVAAEIDGEENPKSAPAAVRRASARYQDLLALRPDSFWGRYRSAVVAFTLARWGEAATHMEECVRRRPGNAVLRGYYASCLLKLDRDDEALDQCNQAIDSAPDRAEFVQTRAFIRAEGSALDGLEQDIRRYELLRSVLPRRFLQAPSGPADESPTTGRNLPLTPAPPDSDRPALDEPANVAPGELDARAVLASRIREAGSDPDGPLRPHLPLDPRRLALAAFEVEKILALDPANLLAQVDRMCLAICRDRAFEAKEGLDRVLADPRLADYARFAPERLDALHYACILFASYNRFDEAHKLARKVLDLALAGVGSQGRANYTMAVVEAIGAVSNRKWIAVAAKHLKNAVDANPKYERWFQRDPAFDPVRIELQAALDAAGILEAGRPDARPVPLLVDVP
ncbi:serine/threonine-protein kinase [Planctomyces sp. SH-PL62]|uniref:serine/threonine-protein kinase n=1 Tax=Planctomyces sp. SH-PL62 TaxID=1636152 RepID=UPI00078DE91A|nr:serine/threonine-protein kinase [Planctomyces sp. SH-PL62]AMV40574.1 Serine/threonine-protein kinase PknH [Planctomyces sp. SH-PL62]